MSMANGIKSLALLGLGIGSMASLASAYTWWKSLISRPQHATRTHKHINIVLVGFGNVNRRLVEILAFPDEFKSLVLDSTQLPTRVRIVGVTTKTHGCLARQSGFSPKEIIEIFRTNNNSFPKTHPNHFHSTSQLDPTSEMLQLLDYDILVESSVLQLKERGAKSTGYIASALASGRHVVTCNKGPLAFHYRELTSLAAKNGVQFLHECCVMDGCPVFSLAQNTLPACSIKRVSGILNSTTNFLLSQMELGYDMHGAIGQAIDDGFAEADPEADIHGWDGAAKVCALANVLMGADIDPFQVRRPPAGLYSISPDHVRQVARNGKRTKFVCTAEYVSADSDGQPPRVVAQLTFQDVDATHPFYSVSGAGSIICIETDFMCPIYIQQTSPDITDTAYGVLADLLKVVEKHFPHDVSDDTS